MGVYHVLTQFVNRAPSQHFGGSKPPPYGVRFICLPVGTPLPGRPENVAFGTMLPGEATGMMRGFPRRADDICPYGAGVVFAPRRGGYQPPANVAVGTVLPEGASIAFPFQGKVPRRGG